MVGNLYEIIEENPNFVVFRNLFKDLVLYEKITSSLRLLDEITFQASTLNDLRSASVHYRFGFPENVRESAVPQACEKLELEVTTGCNCVCPDCIYGGRYSGERASTAPGTAAIMDDDVARRAMRLYIASAHGTPPNVSFWGGEPLLAYPLIENLVREYGQVVHPGITFHLTSNMLLVPCYADSLIRDDIYLTCSHNGPKNIHDKSRAGTYDAVMDAIQTLRHRSSDYFNRLMFSVVLVEPGNIEEVRRYFNQHFPDANIKLSMLARANYTGSSVLMPDQKTRFREWVFNQGRDYVESAYKGMPVDSLMDAHFTPMIKPLETRLRGRVPAEAIIYPMGACIPAYTNLFVDIDGNLSLCPETAGRIALGDVRGGVDEGLVTKCMDQIVGYRNELCGECFGQRCCMFCLAQAKDKDGEISLEGAKIACTNAKATLLNGLSLYSAIRAHKAGISLAKQAMEKY